MHQILPAVAFCFLLNSTTNAGEPLFPDGTPASEQGGLMILRGFANSLKPPAMLIVEGVGAGALDLARHLSVLVWVELDAAARRTRALSRRGRDIGAPQWPRWAEQEDRFFAEAETRERADFVVDTSGTAR